VSAILIISVLLVFVASFAILRTKRSSSKVDTAELPPGVSPRGLFGDTADEDEIPKESPEQLRRDELRERAERGDLSALALARDSKDAALYRFVLDGLVGRASGDGAHVRELAAHIAGGQDLRASPELAEMLLGEWRREPTPASTAELLRVSALSDDAGTFGRAVSEVLQIWEAGALEGLGTDDLRALFEAEYWLLSSEAKRSGAGFVLKQNLADVRRRLSAGARRDAQFDAGERVLEEERPPP
jgi:broad specificity phosphatase PhoE